MKSLAKPYEHKKSMKYIPPPKEDEIFPTKTVKKNKSRDVQNIQQEETFNQTPLHPMPPMKSKILNTGLAPGVPARNAVQW